MIVKSYTLIVEKVAKELNIDPVVVNEVVKDYLGLLKEELTSPSSSRLIIPKLGVLFLRTLTLRSMVRQCIRVLRSDNYSTSSKERVKNFLRKLLKLRHEVYGYSKFRNRITQYKPVDPTQLPRAFIGQDISPTVQGKEE